MKDEILQTTVFLLFNRMRCRPGEAFYMTSLQPFDVGGSAEDAKEHWESLYPAFEYKVVKFKVVEG